MEKDNPRITHGWAMYDWANSVYPLVITTAVFPIYFNAQASAAATGHDPAGRPLVSFFGMEVLASSLLIYAISAAFLIVAAISPLLTALADYSGRKKRFMQFFCALGALSCCALYSFTPDTLSPSILFYILATVGFAGSLVFYNSYLPEIASEENVDRLSARGFSLGYIGSTLLLILCLGLIMGASKLGMEKGHATRLSFLLTGLWWGGFALIPFSRLPKDTGRPAAAGGETGSRYLLNGFRELGKVWRELRHLTLLRWFLLSYFFACMGVQTVLYVATPFAEETLHMESDALILTILILQLLGVAGAVLFSRLSARLGNVKALAAAITVWAAVCAGGYFVQAGWSFYLLACSIGMAMGGVQSLSRSTYAKLIPEDTHDTASWFSFFDVTEKLGIVIGTASFSYISQVSGTMRNSLLVLMVFFILGLGLLGRLWGRPLRSR